MTYVAKIFLSSIKKGGLLNKMDYIIDFGESNKLIFMITMSIEFFKQANVLSRNKVEHIVKDYKGINKKRNKLKIKHKSLIRFGNLLY